jgi:hypothetical protein
VSEIVGRRRFVCCLAVATFLPVLDGCGEPDKRPAGLRLLIAKRAKLRPGMTVAEVDAVMVGLPRKKRLGEWDLPPAAGKSARTVAFLIEYDEKRGANEGDFCLSAWFDEDGKLIWMAIEEYQS